MSQYKLFVVAFLPREKIDKEHDGDLMIASLIREEISITLAGDKFVPLNGQHGNSSADRYGFLMRISSCSPQNAIFRRSHELQHRRRRIGHS
jgi:hypothetical protein